MALAGLVVFAAACGQGAGGPGVSDSGSGIEAGTPDGGADAGGTGGFDGGFVADFPVEVLEGEATTYSRVELRLGYETAAQNPFDLGEVEVLAEFKRPSGRTDEVRGFWYQDYDLSQDPDTGGELLAAAGRAHFRVRYAPPEAGRYHYRVLVNEQGKIHRYGYAGFDVSAGSSPGYVRVDAQNTRYFGFEDGAPFFPVGFNVAWHGAKGFYDYVHYINKLSGAGGDYFRIWMIKWSNALEWTKGGGAGDYGGLGRYAQDNAYRLDRILRHAESRGAKIMLTFGSYLEHTTGGYWNEGAWPENPYNEKNGGPCAEASDFFSDAQAKRWYKNRLAYIAARWGYSTGIFSWELWNEVVAPPEWVLEMARNLLAEDLGRHLISTTYGDKAVYGLPEIGFTQRHLYGSSDDLIYDYTGRVAGNVAEFLAGYEKPHLVSEFGIDWSNSDGYWDPDGEGLNFHNGVWAAVASGAAGTAMLWWWDDYVDKYDLYDVISPIGPALGVFGGQMAGVGRLDLAPEAAPPGAVAYGIGRADAALVWVIATDSTWKNAYDNVPPAGVGPSSVSVPGLRPGCAARADSFDAWTGGALSSTHEATAGPDGAVTVPTPAFERDIYVQVRCGE
jgi:hypothetical protein